MGANTTCKKDLVTVLILCVLQVGLSDVICDMLSLLTRV